MQASSIGTIPSLRDACQNDGCPICHDPLDVQKFDGIVPWGVKWSVVVHPSLTDPSQMVHPHHLVCFFASFVFSTGITGCQSCGYPVTSLASLRRVTLSWDTEELSIRQKDRIYKIWGEVGIQLSRNPLSQAFDNEGLEGVLCLLRQLEETRGDQQDYEEVRDFFTHNEIDPRSDVVEIASNLLADRGVSLKLPRLAQALDESIQEGDIETFEALLKVKYPSALPPSDDTLEFKELIQQVIKSENNSTELFTILYNRVPFSTWHKGEALIEAMEAQNSEITLLVLHQGGIPEWHIREARRLANALGWVGIAKRCLIPEAPFPKIVETVLIKQRRNQGGLAFIFIETQKETPRVDVLDPDVMHSDQTDQIEFSRILEEYQLYPESMTSEYAYTLLERCVVMEKPWRFVQLISLLSKKLSHEKRIEMIWNVINPIKRQLPEYGGMYLRPLLENSRFVESHLNDEILAKILEKIISLQDRSMLMIFVAYGSYGEGMKDVKTAARVLKIATTHSDQGLLRRLLGSGETARYSLSDWDLVMGPSLAKAISVNATEIVETLLIYGKISEGFQRKCLSQARGSPSMLKVLSLHGPNIQTTSSRLQELCKKLSSCGLRLCRQWRCCKRAKQKIEIVDEKMVDEGDSLLFIDIDGGSRVHLQTSISGLTLK